MPIIEDGPINNSKVNDLEKGTLYRCNVCNMYEYDEKRGDSTFNIKPETKPEEFPNDWRCPFCGVKSITKLRIEGQIPALGVAG